MRFTFTVPGAPQGKGRHRTRVVHSKKSGKSFATQYADPKTRSYEGMVKFFAQQAMTAPPFTGPLHMEIIAIMPIPNSWPAWKRQAAIDGVILPTGKPDKDNIEKAVSDALNGVVWIDDTQVVSGLQEKRYGETPKVIVVIEPRTGKVGSNITSRKELPQEQEAQLELTQGSEEAATA